MKLRSRKVLACAAVVALFACAVAGATQPGAQAASSNVSVQFTVSSQTTLTPTLCASGLSGRTDFGTVLPATKTISGDDCRVVFGSTNDTARLLLTQTDREGGPLWGGKSSGLGNPGFGGGDGWLTDSFIPVSHEEDYDATLQADMKIVTVGAEWFGGSRDYSVTRFNSDGSRDTGFGAGGNVRINRGFQETATTVAIEADQHILISGHEDNATSDTTIARLDASGNVDTTWGTGGYVTHDLRPAGFEEMLDMSVQPDGKIVLAGYVGALDASTNAIVVRLMPDGSLDPSFGVGGKREIDVNGALDLFWEMDVLPDGRLLMAGQARETTFNRDDMLAVRLTPTGGMDPTFGGGDGIATFDASTGNVWDKAWSVEQLPNGRILLGGSTQLSGADDELFVVRMLADGTLDTTFGVGGKFTRDNGGQDDQVIDLDVMPDGTIALAGSKQLDQLEVQTWRLKADGSGLDTRYSGDGYAGITITGHTKVAVREQLIAADGSILLAGYAENGAADYDHLLVRFNSASVPSYAGGAWSASSPLFGACLRDGSNITPTWLKDGNLTCTAADSDPWKAIARVETDPTAEIARVASGVANGTVDLRFGMNLAATQRPGPLVAPVTFQVIAPG